MGPGTVSDRPLRLLVFTEGTLLLPAAWTKLTRAQAVARSRDGADPAAKDFANQAPIGSCVEKLRAWKAAGATILYLTSRRDPREVEAVREALRRHAFPVGELVFRRGAELYRDVAERVLPDAIVEDDCESIGGEKEMTYPHIHPEIRERIAPVTVREFGGIDHLPDDPAQLLLVPRRGRGQR